MLLSFFLSVTCKALSMQTIALRPPVFSSLPPCFSLVCHTEALIANLWSPWSMSVALSAAFLMGNGPINLINSQLPTLVVDVNHPRIVSRSCCAPKIPFRHPSCIPSLYHLDLASPTEQDCCWGLWSFPSLYFRMYEDLQSRHTRSQRLDVMGQLWGWNRFRPDPS